MGADGQISKPEVGQLAKRAAALIRANGMDRKDMAPGNRDAEPAGDGTCAMQQTQAAEADTAASPAQD